MGLQSAFSIGKTALSAMQTGLNVTGNNIANAATPNYSRQHVVLLPNRGLGGDFKVGTGVRVDNIVRHYDAMVEARLRSAMSDLENRQIQESIVARIEQLYQETTNADLSTALTGFFNGFEDLAGNPQDLGMRRVVIERTRTLVGTIQRMRSGLDELNLELNNEVNTSIREINRLTQELADLNDRVLDAEQGDLGSAPNLRDERDAVLRELSGYIKIRAVEQDSGAINVLVGNQVLIDGRNPREVVGVTGEHNGMAVTEVHFADNDEALGLLGGSLAGAITSRDEWVGEQVADLDTLASSLVYQVNRLHAEGIGTKRLGEYASERFVYDTTIALNDPETGLKNLPGHGSFLVHVTNSSSGLTETAMINVDLDGIGADDSLEDVAAKLDAIDGISATATATGHLEISGDSNEVKISFTEDSSGLLACLGINNLLTGYDSRTVGISEAIAADPQLLAAGLSGDKGDNANALRIAGLADASLEALSDNSMLDYHRQSATSLAVNAAATKSAAEAASGFMESMYDEREKVSGVNLDEEAVNLIRYQKAYAAAARLMSLLSDLMDDVINM